MLNSYLAILPEVILIVWAAVILVYGRKPTGERKRKVGIATAWGAVVSLVVVIAIWFFDVPSSNASEWSIWGGMFLNDPVTLVFRVIFLGALIITSLISVDVKRLQHGEYYALLLLSTVGFNLMAASGDIIMLYLSLETASISFYVLSGFATDARRSPEAGIKYFVYGAFASGVMLYGLSLIYGFSGGLTNILDLANYYSQPSVAAANGGILLLSGIMILVGFGFKISSVPFHFWAPDVYEGAPTPVTGILSTASKAAGFAVFLRLFLAGTFGSPDTANNTWAIILVMAVATMTFGNLGAIFQRNIKRMLAYSGVGQAGYIMLGLIAYTVDGAGSVLFYLLMYMFTNIASFAVVILVSNVTGSDAISDFSGLSRRSPFLALVMLFGLLSLGGIPPTAGFFGKLFLFRAVVDAGYWGLALVGVLNAFIALYYYLNVAKYIYLYRSDDDEVAIPVTRAAQMALALSTLGVLYLGIVPGAFFEWTRAAAAAFPLLGG